MLFFWRGTLNLLAVISLVSLIIGTIFEEKTGWIVFSLCLLMIVLYHTIYRATLFKWLQKPNHLTLPNGIGHWEEIFALLYRLIKSQKQSQQNLSERLDTFRLAASAMPEGFIILNSLHRIEWCNPQAEVHFGVNAEKDIGQQVTHLVRRPEFIAYLSAQNYHEPLKLKGLHSEEQSLSVQLVPYGADKKLVMSRDITQWEKIETVRRDFVANVSHEMRTPLTVLRGFLETLSDLENIQPHVLKRSLQLMSEQTNRMNNLVEDLLILTRVENYHQLPSTELVNTPYLIQQVINDANQLSRGRHTINLHKCENIRIHGIEDELRSVFSNIVSNAVRYTPEGGTIDVSWHAANNEGIFSVKDNGVGISAEHIPRLTERFYRVDRSRSRDTGGTGLGLAIVRHILMRHQARLEIESTLGKGSTFKAIFPSESLNFPEKNLETTILNNVN